MTGLLLFDLRFNLRAVLTKIDIIQARLVAVQMMVITGICSAKFEHHNQQRHYACSPLAGAPTGFSQATSSRPQRPTELFKSVEDIYPALCAS